MASTVTVTTIYVILVFCVFAVASELAKPVARDSAPAVEALNKSRFLPPVDRLTLVVSDLF